MPRPRRTNQPMGSILDQVQARVDQLIHENKELKREIARLSAAGAGSVDRRTLVGIQRRLETVVGASRPRAQARSPRRKVTDPEVLEKRRAALAKARSVLAEKRAGG